MEQKLEFLHIVILGEVRHGTFNGKSFVRIAVGEHKSKKYTPTALLVLF